MCQLYSQVKGHVSNSNSIFLHLDLEDTTIICYNVEAGNYSKTVRIGGSLTLGMYRPNNCSQWIPMSAVIYNIEPSYEKNNMLAHVYIAALVPVVITVLGTTTTLFYLVRYKPKKSLNLLEEYTLDSRKSSYYNTYT